MRATRVFSYGVAVATVLAALVVGRLMGEIAPFRSGLFLLAAIVFSAWRGGGGPALVATVLAVFGSLVWDPPAHRTNVYLVEAVRVAVFTLAGLLTSSMGASWRRAHEQLVQTRNELQARAAEVTRELGEANENLRQQIAVRERTERELLAYQAQLRHLAAEVSMAEERERKRIATQLHDDIGQSLSICQMHLESVRDVVPPDVSGVVGQVIETLDQTITQTRTLTCELSPPVLRELGLAAALQWLAEQVAAAPVAQLNISVDAEREPVSLDEGLRVLLFQVARELLANVVKHAKARHAVVTLYEQDEIVRLTVSDDGVGLNGTAAAGAAPPQSRRATSFGLFNVRERLKHRGGWLEVESTPGRGARFTVAVPVGEGSAVGPTGDRPVVPAGADVGWHPSRQTMG